MNKTKNVLLLTFLLLVVAALAQTTEIRHGLKHYYQEYRVKGSFALYNMKEDKYLLYNPSQFDSAFSPASTFKICNSIIGLETGVIKDENFVIKWDSTQYQNPNWNKDTDLKTAFQNSTVWYYQHLARLVGAARMKEWLDKLNYGNADITGGIDKFWLKGGLLITPHQQLEFLKRLYKGELPISSRTLQIVKRIFIKEVTKRYVLCGKAGWAVTNNTNIGWFVGYVETKTNTFFFVNCVQNDDMDYSANFAESREAITRKILRLLAII
jgi:beta-lactamase class D